MKNKSKNLRHTLIVILSEIYDKRESESIANIYFEDRFNIKNFTFDEFDEEKLHTFNSDLLKFKNNVPVQYITGKAWFYKSFFSVNKSVLIPRSETEELVDLVLKSYQKNSKIQILDIGTGSGCIALSIAKYLPYAYVEGIDISDEAILICKKNMQDLNVRNASFDCVDFLNRNKYFEGKKYDLIVSNPPYISFSEKHLIGKSTLDHEPDIALFPQNEDPLIFYRSIFKFAGDHLVTGGKIICEINEFRSKEIAQIIPEHVKSWIIHKDINNKDRILEARI
jgi:release factor glutamine methyltransferase